MSSTYTATSSSELMENYIQSDILEPQQAFTALQTDTGASLLFSIGTGAVFYVTQELPGAAHGWSLTDLSSAQVRQDFPAGATAKTFAAAETVAVPPQPAAIHLAMVLNDGTADHLYLSLGNSASDTGWTANPVWTPCPFNATDGAGNPIPMPSPFSIVGVMISEATEGEYIVVDIVGNPGDPVGLVSRFYIDVSTPANPVWTPRSLPIDVNAASYASCLGRTSKNPVEPDGFYTTGTVVNAPQLIYMPLYDPLSPSVTPASSRLTLPGGLAAEAIAACRNADNTSDLYVTAQGGLYYFAAANQADQAVAVLLVSSPLLTGVRNLYAYAAGDSVTVWGLNGSDQVFYLACPAAQLTTPSAWNVPLAIMTGVDAISPYVDRMYSANTFFAHGADGLIKAVKTPTTGLWSSRNITLPPSDVQQDATRISSYTTRILVNGPDGLPAANVSVSLTATSVTSVLINHLYYVVGPTPITLTTDAFGTITIVEMVDTLAGTRFTATVSGVALAINPMDPPFQRNAQYTTVQSLQGPGVVITNQDGSTQPFIPAGTSATDLASVAQSNQDLASAYASLATSSPPSSQGVRTAAAGVLPHAADGILTDLGDLFEWLKSGIESVVSIVWDAVGKAWNFVATIGDQIYYGVLDGVEKVVAAATWVYNAIKIAVEDVVKFLSFLFSWPDILITHQVLRNVFSLFLTNAVTSLGDVKTDLDNLFQTLQSDIGSWADFPDLTQTASSTTASNPPVAGQNSAPAHLGLHHFQGNAANSQSDYAPADPALAIFDDLYQAWQKEEATLQAAFDQFKTIIDNFSSESLSDIIKQLLAVLVDTLLQSAQNILDALLTLLIQLATGASDVLTQPLNIPVLSWLYKDLTEAGPHVRRPHLSHHRNPRDGDLQAGGRSGAVPQGRSVHRRAAWRDDLRGGHEPVLRLQPAGRRNTGPRDAGRGGSGARREQPQDFRLRIQHLRPVRRRDAVDHQWGEARLLSGSAAVPQDLRGDRLRRQPRLRVTEHLRHRQHHDRQLVRDVQQHRDHDQHRQERRVHTGGGSGLDGSPGRARLRSRRIRAQSRLERPGDREHHRQSRRRGYDLPVARSRIDRELRLQPRRHAGDRRGVRDGFRAEGRVDRHPGWLDARLRADGDHRRLGLPICTRSIALRYRGRHRRRGALAAHRRASRATPFCRGRRPRSGPSLVFRKTSPSHRAPFQSPPARKTAPSAAPPMGAADRPQSERRSNAFAAECASQARLTGSS